MYEIKMSFDITFDKLIHANVINMKKSNKKNNNEIRHETRLPTYI